ncbi:MAG TPA: hypothetical protein VFV52_17595, partial [Bacilli bacterium]|nr:hypothetical protein [Bacilli bacterium]
HQKISFHPLTFMPEEDGISIGRFGTDTFAVFPEDGAELVKRLQAGMTIGEAKQWYMETYQEDLDIDDFLDILRDLTFVNEEGADTEAAGRLLLGQRLGKWAFSPVAWVVYALLFSGAAYFLWHYQEFRPHRNLLFFSDYSTLIILGLFAGQVPGLLFHESMHLLAGRRLGIPSTMSFGRRLYYFVFEASMPGIWGLPRNRRYLPFLAGMFGDLLWYAGLIIAAGLLTQQSGEVGSVARWCLALSFGTVLRIIWQFYFHLQTDIYYVFTTMLGCINLQQTTKELLKNVWYRAIRARHKMIDPANWAPRDLQVARWYVWFYSLGCGVMLAVMVLVMIPVAFRFLSTVYENLIHGDTAHIWDSITFVTVNGINYGLVFWMYLRERKARRRQAVQAPLTQGG